jgi:hypothetical protein
MPTSQAPTMFTLLDDIESQLDLARDTSDLQELRAILRRPTRVPVNERTYLLTMLRVLRDQLDVVRDLRAGVVDSLRQSRPPSAETNDD